MDFNAIISTSNLKKAGAVALANYLAFSFTAGKSKLVTGVAMVAVTAITLPLAARL